VPYSVFVDGRIHRGVVACLRRHADGSLEVLECDETALAESVSAMRTVFPTALVRGKLTNKRHRA
jgi:hypothetical protein